MYPSLRRKSDERIDGIRLSNNKAPNEPELTFRHFRKINEENHGSGGNEIVSEFYIKGAGLNFRVFQAEKENVY